MGGWACGFICLYFVPLFFVGGPAPCFFLRIIFLFFRVGLLLDFFLCFVGGPGACFFYLGTVSNNQNGNLRWFLPLGVDPPPLMAKISRHFLPHFFSFAIESYIYETDFTL